MTKLIVARAAVSLFSTKGFAATGIRELGNASGINSATLYHHFPDKSHILTFIIENCLDAFVSTGLAALESTSPRTQLAAAIAGHTGLTATNPATSLVTELEMRALTTEQHDAMQAHRDQYEDIIQQIVERGITSGDFNVDNPTLSRITLLEMCTSASHWFRTDGPLSVTDIQHELVKIGFRIMGATPPTPQELNELPTAIKLETEPQITPQGTANP